MTTLGSLYLETFRLTSSHLPDETTTEVSKGIRADAIPNPASKLLGKNTTTNVGLTRFGIKKLQRSFDYFTANGQTCRGPRISTVA